MTDPTPGVYEKAIGAFNDSERKAKAMGEAVKVQWHWGRWGRLRFLVSPEYRRCRRLALARAQELADDPDHVAKVNAIVARRRAEQA